MGGENVSYPILYESNATDFFNLGLGTLPDAISALVTEERNGEFIFEMSYPIDGTRADLIKNNRIIKADAGHLLKDQRFVIKTVTPHMESNGQTTIQVYAEHISYLANDLTLKPSVSVADMDAQAALNQWKKNIIDQNDFTVDSDISTKTSTTWTIDKVQNARQALGGVEGSILDRWKGEYRFDNLHISLLKARGTTANTLLAYGRNITDFQQEENIINTYTSIYPYATLSSATGDDQLMYTLDDYVVDSEYVGNYPNRKTEPIDFGSEFENVKVGTKPSGDKAEKDTTYLSIQQVQDKLKALAQQYIKNNNVGIPTVSIKVSFVDLSRTTNYADMAPLEELDLCDNVPVRFSKLGINTTAKVSRVVWNVLTDSYDSLELGEISATLGDKLNEISDNTDHAKNEVDKWKNIVQTAANGINTVFRGPDTPVANHINDLWYKPNGQDTEMYQWNGVTWVFIMSTKETSELKDLVDQAMKDIDDAAAKANQAITDAGFATDTATTAKEVANGVKGDVADAKSDSANALQQAQDAMTNATDAKTTANSIKTDVDTVKGELTSKADKTDVDNLSGTVKTQGTAITQNAKDIESKASQSDVNTLTGRVETAESNITQNANSIKSKVSSSDVQGILDNGGYATQTWTGSQIDQKANEISSTVTEVSNKVDNLEIGGRNLIENSQPSSKSGWFFSSGGTNDYRVVDGQYIELTRTGGSYHQVNCQYQNDKDGWYSEIKPGDQFAISMDISMTTVPTVDSNIYGQLRLIAGGTFNSTQHWWNLKDVIKKANTWYRVSAVADIPDNWETDFTKATMARFLIESQLGSDTDVIRIRNIKLEKGNKATDWSPAPEDMATVTALSKVDQKADSISTTVTNNKSDADSQFTNINQTIGGIQSTVKDKADSSTVTQLSNQINLKVSQADFDNLSVGGNNLLSDTDHYILYTGNGGTNQIAEYYEFTDGIISNWAVKGRPYTLSFDWMTTGTPKGTFQPQFWGTPWSGWSDRGRVNLSNQSSGHMEVNSIADDTWINSNAKAQGIEFRTDNFTGGLVIYNVKLENGNKATPWMTAPTEPSPNLLADADIADTSQYRSYGKYFSDAGNSQVNIDFKSGVSTPTSNSLSVVEATNTKANNNQKAGRNLAWLHIVMSPGETYTMSCYAKKTSGSASIRFQYGRKGFYSVYQTVDSTTWKKYSWTFVFNGDANGDDGYCQVYLGGISNEFAGTVQSTGFRLERANSSLADKADIDKLVSQINLDKSGVLISGEKVMIDGDTYIKNGVIKSAMIDTLDASKITAGTLNAANVNIINLNVSKLVGNTTDFVKSAWNSIDKYVYISGDGMQIVGDWGANVYDDWGIRSYAYNASNNLELVGNFSSTYAVGDKNINGTLVSADYEGDFVGIGYRNEVGDNFTPMVGYFKKDQTALGWYQGTNIVGHLILHDYIKPLGGTADYIQIGSIKFNNINYAYVGNSSGKAGFAYGTGYVYLISQGTSFRMGGWKIPVDITSDGKVKSWISLPGSYN